MHKPTRKPCNFWLRDARDDSAKLVARSDRRRIMAEFSDGDLLAWWGKFGHDLLTSAQVLRLERILVRAEELRRNEGIDKERLAVSARTNAA